MRRRATNCARRRSFGGVDLVRAVHNDHLRHPARRAGGGTWVSIVGPFAVLLTFGFSINTLSLILSLFGSVLAIGIAGG